MNKKINEGVIMSLRIKCKRSPNLRLNQLSSKEKISTLLDSLEKLTGISADKMILLKGFPPKKIEYEKNNLVESLGLAQQDTLIVEYTNDDSETKVEGIPGEIEPKIIPIDIEKNAPESFDNTSIPPPKESLPTGTSTSESSNQKATESFPCPSKSNVPSQDVSEDERIARAISQNEKNTTPAKGILMRKTIAADNSCLFRSVRFSLTGEDEHEENAMELRKLIAQTVAQDPERFNEAFLGRPNADYEKWILNGDSWGGGIEIAILSEFYNVEISVVDTQHLCVSHFGEDQNYPNRVILIYDGIHYDPLYLETFEEGKMQTVFATTDSGIILQALELAKEAKASRQFTDPQNFCLVCNQCQVMFRGEKEALEHANTTGHTNFSEVQQ